MFGNFYFTLMNLLNEKIVNDFQLSGVCIIKNIINKHWLNILAEGIEENFKKPSQYKCVYEKIQGNEIFYDDYCNWQRIPEYKNFLLNSKIANIAANLMQSKKVNLFHEHVLIKEVGAQKKTPWHQDQSYYCIQGRQNISFWIPLDKILKATSKQSFI